MNVPRDRNEIVVAWLEAGPTELPEATRRAIAVAVRSTHQSGRSWWAPWAVPTMLPVSPVALMAVVVIVVLGGLAWLVGDPDSGGSVGGGPSATPSASPSPSPSQSPAPSPSQAGSTVLPIPAMTQVHVSQRYGYTIRFPADWSSRQASHPWWPPDWKSGVSSGDPFDYIAREEEPPIVRVASALLPEELANVDDWIDDYLTFSDAPGCAPQRETQELVRIDGAPGRLRDSCGEVEATVVVEGRVYLFTLFLGGDAVTNARELFDAFAETIDLRPEDALESPSPSPS